MENEKELKEAIPHYIGDEYASRILRATYGRPMSVQQISSQCDIPIAVAYRRIGEMERLCLVRCVRTEEVYRGKKVKFYSCAVRVLRYAFERGDFSIQIDWIPEEEMEEESNVGMEG
jgi:hypothetical protein